MSRPPVIPAEKNIRIVVNAYRKDYNHVRPHEAIAWNRPTDVHTGLASPTIPNFEIEETLPTT